ncbi:MAG: type IX secretion system membrane protein PorP/SprF [Bacteroidales bacterium]|nr:type IX secretion system membrane protein PorP/SprF [Bacteroidales bacterium]
MIYKTYISVILFFLLINSGYAQQSAQITHHMFSIMSYNPGYAGSNNAICADGIIRQQWVGFKDAENNNVAPETFLFTINSPIKILKGGVSANLIQDKIGFQKDIGLNIGYAYHLDISGGDLGIGAQIGFLNRTIDFSKYISVETDPLLNSLSGEESDMMIDFSLGLFYQVPEQYYIGFSATNLLQSPGKTLTEAGGNPLRMQLDRTFFLTAGYTFPLPNHPSFSLTPSFLVKSEGASIQYDISSILTYNNKFWGGVSYRGQGEISVLLGVYYKDFRIGYSYDIDTSVLGSNGSHEIMLGYCFKLKTERARKSYKNTRFL